MKTIKYKLYDYYSDSHIDKYTDINSLCYKFFSENKIEDKLLVISQLLPYILENVINNNNIEKIADILDADGHYFEIIDEDT